MERISTVIMSHPSRSSEANGLRNTLDQLEAGVELVIDPDPTGPPSSLRSARLAWTLPSEGATHRLVLQDDAEPHPAIYTVIRRAIRSLGPDMPLCLFASWSSCSASLGRVSALCGAGIAEVADHYVPSVALVLPMSVATDFGEFIRHQHADGLPDDQAMWAYLRHHGLAPVVAYPNPVEHADMPSLTGNLWRGPRRSACPLLVHDSRPAPRYRPEITVAPHLSFRSNRLYVLERDNDGIWQRVEVERFIARNRWLIRRMRVEADLSRDLASTYSIDDTCARQLVAVTQLAGALAQLYVRYHDLDLDSPRCATFFKLLVPGALRRHHAIGHLIEISSELGARLRDVIRSKGEALRDGR